MIDANKLRGDVLATTHAKIREALRQAASKKKASPWKSVGDLADALQKSGSDEFAVSGKAISTESMRRLVRLMLSLEFIEELEDGTIQVTSSGTAAIPEDKFNKKTVSAIRSYLDRNGLSIEMVVTTIANIKLPQVPDADTIYEALNKGVSDKKRKDEKREISKDLFRTLLYLYAVAEGLDRRVRVFYGEG